MRSAMNPRRFSKARIDPLEAEADSATSAEFSGARNSTGLIAHAPMLISGGVPEYPESARQREIEGQVTLQIVVDAAGQVESNVKVIESIPALNAAAIDAVRRWRFAPGRDRDGKPIRVSVKVPLRFVLR
jgi:protein TonB